MEEEKNIQGSVRAESVNEAGEIAKKGGAVHGTSFHTVDAGQEILCACEESTETSTKTSTDTDTTEENTGKEAEKGINEATDSELEELIRGRYARAFAARVQKIIDKRFKEARLERARLCECEEFISRLKILVGEEDSSALLCKLEKNFSKKPTRGESEISDMIEKAKQTYPDFEEKKELANEVFKKYIETGLDYRDAYTLTHLEEIKEKSQRSGASQAVRSISSCGMRPVEGEGGQGPVRTEKRKISSLGSKEIKNLIERAGRGEKIKFSDI